MKRADLIQRGIRPKTLDDMDLDITRAVIDEEFARPHPALICYRERSIDRLVRLGVPFSSDSNLLGDMAKRYMRMTCPYCGGDMAPKYQGGTPERWRVEFTCDCKAKVTLVLQGDGLSLIPPVGDHP